MLHVPTRKVALDLYVLVPKHEDALRWELGLRNKLLIWQNPLVLNFD